MWFIYISLIIIVILTIKLLKWKFTYWQRRNVPIPFEPSIPLGHARSFIFGNRHFSYFFREIYEQLKKKNEKFGGIYLCLSNMFIPVAPEMVKQILVKDFDHFTNRGLYFNEKLDPLNGNLFSLSDEKWRSMRVKLTPTFTSGKMKMMFQTMLDCAKELEKVFENYASASQPIHAKDILSQFTTDVIASCAFGLNLDTLKNRDSTFRDYASKFFMNIPIIRQFLFQAIMKLFGVRSIPKDVHDFYTKIIKDNVDYREKHNIFRKDFMHLLIQLKNRGVADGSAKILNDDGNCGEFGLTMNELSAQAFAFFVAAYESSSSSMSFTLYEIAQNLDIQNKMREEIFSVLKNHNNELSYNALMDMKYIDCVINESLRKYPVAPGLVRLCNKDFTIPDSEIVIEKGTQVVISVLGLHHDEEFYPNPEKFDPERFNEENKNSRPAYTYLPFGEGPRVCIGMRFAVMQIKVGLIALLKHHSISLNRASAVPLKFPASGPLLDPKDQIVVDIKKID